ncbi:MAG: dienelactone hydrolase family protein [Phycisphaerales bacterium]
MRTASPRSCRPLVVLMLLAACVFPALDREASAEVRRERINYEVGGNAYFGWKLWDDARPAPRPGVLLFHEFFGLESFIVERGVALAEAGYVVFVADMYGMNVDGTNVVADTPEEAVNLASALYQDRPEMGRRATAAFLRLARQSEVDPGRIVAIGYGFGGTAALELARGGTTLDGVVVVHGSLWTPDPGRNARIKGEVLVLRGGKDPFVTDDEVVEFRASMERSTRRVSFTNYAWAQHSFSNRRSTSWGLTGIGHDAEAAEASERAILAFMERVVDGPTRGTRIEEKNPDLP